MRLARTIERDIGALGSLRLNGYLSCQLQRVAFPSGFPLYVLGRKLWNQSLSYEALKKEYFCAAYGQFAEEIEIVLERISSWLTDDYMHHRLPERDGEVRMRAERERGECKKLSGRIDEMISAGSGWLRERLKLISFCLQYTQKLLTLIEAKAGGEQTQVDALLEEIDQFLFAKEPEVQPYMDVGQYYVNVKILAGDHW